MIKIGLVVAQNPDGGITVTAQPYDDRDEASLAAFDESVLQAAGDEAVELPDLLKQVRRRIRRMKVKSIHLSRLGSGDERHQA